MNKYKNKEWLEKAFLEIGNKVEIGRMCDVSSDTIEYWRKSLTYQNQTKEYNLIENLKLMKITLK